MEQNYKTYPTLAMDEVMETFARHTNGSLPPINFGKGTSSFNPFDYVEVPLTHNELSSSASYGIFNGLLELRCAICRHYQEKFGYDDLTPDRICITNGASDALMVAFAMLVKPGSEVILAQSHFPSYRLLLHLFDAKCRFVPVKEDYSMDVEQLPKFISKQTQAILINSPGNPHGAFLSAEELEAITSLGVPVICDEVYQSLSLTGERIPSAIRFSDRHLIVNSFSKSLSIAGFRVGYLIVPPDRVDLMTNVQATKNICTSLPAQLLAKALFAHWDDLIEKHRKMLIDNWHTFRDTASELGLCLRNQPKAGFFAMVDISESGLDSMSVAMELVKHYAISSAPGVDFQSSATDFLRLNFACPSHQIEPGLRRLAAYL